MASATALAFRLAAGDDLLPLKALVESAYRGESAQRGWSNEAGLLDDERISLEDLAAAIADPANHILLAEADGALIGTVTVTEKAAGRGYLGMLAIDPARQAGGLGRAVLAEAEALAISLGIQRLEMTVISVRHELIAYYERRGYVRTGEMRPFPNPAITHLDMVVLDKALG